MYERAIAEPSSSIYLPPLLKQKHFVSVQNTGKGVQLETRTFSTVAFMGLHNIFVCGTYSRYHCRGIVTHKLGVQGRELQI